MSYTKSDTRRILMQSFGQITYPDGHKQFASPTGLLLFSASRSGTSVPNFREKIRKRKDASSSYSRRDFRILKLKPHLQTAVVNDESTNWSFGFHNVGIPPTSLLASSYTAAEERALRSFYKNLTESMEQFQAIPFIKEFAQAKQLLGETALRAFNHFYKRGGQLGAYARKLKRQKRPWRLASQDISKRWIEYQFGLAPLVSDLEGLSQAVREPGYSLLVNRGSSGDMIIDHNVYSGPISYNSCSATYSGFQRKSVGVRFTAGYNIVPGIGERLGMSLRSIPGAAWEITPWSFLVDYFLDVSGFIASQTYATLPLVYATRSAKTRLYGLYHTGPIAANQSSYLAQRYSRFGTFEWECINTTRSKLDSMPFYLPTLKIGEGLTTFHGLNISALLGMKIRAW